MNEHLENPTIVNLSRFGEFQKQTVNSIYVVVNFLFQVIFIFLLFLGMVIYANEVETKEK